MENILPTWPELEEQTEQSKSSSPPVKIKGFSVWTEKELQAVLNSTPGHMASLRKEGELQTIVGNVPSSRRCGTTSTRIEVH